MIHTVFSPMEFDTVGEMEMARARRKGAYICGHDGVISVCGWLFGGVFYIDHVHKAHGLEYPGNQALKQFVPACPCSKCWAYDSGILLGEKYQRVCNSCGHHGPTRATVDEADAAWNKEIVGE